MVVKLERKSMAIGREIHLRIGKGKERKKKRFSCPQLVFIKRGSQGDEEEVEMRETTLELEAIWGSSLESPYFFFFF